MTQEIFAKHAQAYWDKGISVIPLRIMSKRPAIDAWTNYKDHLPSPTEQEAWLRMYRQNNIGILPGKQSDLVFIDIDTNDEKIIKAITDVTGHSPWKRVGAKGFVYAFRFSGERAQKISQKGGTGHLVEILSSGNQVVLPPSIHPDTKKPYVESMSLIEAYDKLPWLPKDVYTLLRESLSQVVELSAGGTGQGDKDFRPSEITSQGSRDVKMTSYAGTLVREILRGERSLKDALDLMEFWCVDRAQSVEGDSLDPNKGLGKVVEFLKRDVLKGRILPVGWDIGITPAEKLNWELNFSEDEEEWTLNQIMDYMTENFATCQGPADPVRLTIVNKVLKKLAFSKSLGQLEQGQVILHLKKSSGLELPVGHYNRALAQLKAGPIEGTSHVQIANAVMELWEERYGQLRYCEESFWQWEGSHWTTINKLEIWKMIAEEFGELAAAKKASDHNGIISVLKSILPNRLCTVESPGVNFTNGYLTRSLDLLNHQPEHGMRYCLDYAYRPELAGKCPMFFNYLESIWGHHPDYKDKVQAIREAMAATLFGVAPRFQRAFMLSGVAGSGKSVLLEVIQGLVHKDVRCTIKPEDWAEDYSLAMLNGKLLNITGETDDKKKISGAVFKTIVAGEPMTARTIYKEPFEFKSKCAHFFAGNYLPKTSDISNGFNRRWLMFSFDQPLAVKDKIVEYGRLIVESEIEAIVAWAIESYPGLEKRGDYTIPASHYDLLSVMTLSNSVLRSWKKERLEEVEGAVVSLKDLHRDFWSYCALTLINKVYTPPEFRQQWQQILLEEGKMKCGEGPGGEVYYGFKLKEKK